MPTCKITSLATILKLPPKQLLPTSHTLLLLHSWHIKQIILFLIMPVLPTPIRAVILEITFLINCFSTIPTIFQSFHDGHLVQISFCRPTYYSHSCFCLPPGQRKPTLQASFLPPKTWCKYCFLQTILQHRYP